MRASSFLFLGFVLFCGGFLINDMKVSKLFVPLAIVLAFSACSSKKDVMPEAALPADSDIMFVFDGDRGGDFGELMDLIDSFPKREKEGFVEQAWNSDGTLPEYAKYVKPVLKGDFRVAVSIDEVADPSKAESGSVLVAASFEKADAFEKLLLEVLKANDVKVSAEQKGGKKFWDNGESMFAGRDGDLFVFSISRENVDQALERVEKKSGFAVMPEAEDRLGYVRVDGAFMGKALGQVYGSSVSTIESSIVYVDADKKGLSFESEMMKPEGEELETLKKAFGDIDYRLDLMKELRVDKPIAFLEMPSFGKYAEAVSYSFFGQLNQVDPSLVPNDLDVFGTLAEMLKMDKVALEEFLDGPFAVVMGDSEMLYPTMAFYLGMDKGDLETGRSLTVKMDEWMADLIQMYDSLATAQGFGTGALKREITAVGGKGLHKLYFDFKALPADILAAAAFVPGLDIDSLKAELYYGLTADDHFVVAFYPDFAQAYEKAPIVADDAMVKEALKGFDVKNAYMMSFFLPNRFVEIFDRWIELAKSASLVDEGQLADYDYFAHQIVGRFKSFVSVGSVDDDKVKSEGRIEVEN